MASAPNLQDPAKRQYDPTWSNNSTTSSTEISHPADSDEEKPKFINGSDIKVEIYRGMMMLRCLQTMEDRVQEIRNLTLRDDDVLLCSYPKSGTHWMFRSLDMLMTRSAEYSSRTMIFTMLDLQPIYRVHNADSPRILVTHYPFDMLPLQVRSGNVKIVHVYRNPKAILVSGFFNESWKYSGGPETLQDLQDQFLADRAIYNSVFYYCDKVKEFEEKNPNVSILHVSFEEMKTNAVSCIKKLSVFLHGEADEELCSRIAQAVSFDHQKKHESGQKKEFFRRGEAEDWKNHMTVAQSERMDQVMHDRAHACRFSVGYLPHWI